MWITSGSFINDIFLEKPTPQTFFNFFKNTLEGVEFLVWWFILGFIFFAFISYLIGSINTGQIMSKIKKEDLGSVGSGNFGSTNAWRAWGAIGFALVFSFDVLKSIIAGIILWIIAAEFASLAGSIEKQQSLTLSLYMAIPLSLIFVSIGHAYPLFFKFKGGKCVATSFGLIILINWVMAIIAILVFLVILKTTRNMALASMTGTAIGGALLMFVPFFFIGKAYLVVAPWALMWTIWPATFFVILIVELKHIPNVLRMIQGEELLLKNEG